MNSFNFTARLDLAPLVPFPILDYNSDLVAEFGQAVKNGEYF